MQSESAGSMAPFLIFCTFFLIVALGYVNFIARDSRDFFRNGGPSIFACVFGSVVLLTPFLMAFYGVNLAESKWFTAILAIAVASFLVPAIFGNRTGHGSVMVENIVEKALAALVIAAIIRFFSKIDPSTYWYHGLFGFGIFCILSRTSLVYKNISYPSKSIAWRSPLGRQVRIRLIVALICYGILGILIGVLVQLSSLHTKNWNTGGSQLLEVVCKAHARRLDFPEERCEWGRKKNETP